MIRHVQFSFNDMLKIANACDDSYDGLFFYAVETTGIFCRPSCKSKRPNEENVTFFQTSGDAKQAGFRPCKRCQPEMINFDPQMEIINMAKGYIDEHYMENITLQRMAQHIGISPYYLARVFKKNTSKTIHSYLENIRINQAVHLLQTTNRSIIDICYEVGFVNSSSFYYAFRKKTQKTPKQLRRESRHDL